MDSRTYKRADVFAYAGMGVYSLFNLAWIQWALSGAGFGIFDTAGFIGLVVPVVGLSCLIVFQCASRENRLSALANVLALMVMLGWFLAVWSIVVEASAAV
ncbi:hypothetical protein [Verrucomicrobium sp. BvORR106]|uniref:hypothetical protein n=1 Tax=Verrucomicrobium sp. BvORR106 TaxID=1403819 RepID=UPI000570F3FC|nr:hypothetical protein [Verrucomicrobium sp. BvORR106]